MELQPSNSGLQLIAWNPNGLHKRYSANSIEIKRLYREYDPDIMIWNETKGNDAKQDKMQKLVDSVTPGLKWYWNNSVVPGRFGVAISIKPHINVLSVDYGFYETTKESEGRIITLELEKCYIVGIYAVNAGEKDLKRLQYKQEWIVMLHLHLEKLKKSNPHKAVITMGDMNIAAENLDIHNHKRNQKSAGFTKEEREIFMWFKEQGWVDIYREKYPQKVEYTFFNTRSNAKARNAGWRIDLAMIDKQSFDKLNIKDDTIIDCKILRDFDGSDHVPILLKITL